MQQDPQESTGCPHLTHLGFSLPHTDSSRASVTRHSTDTDVLVRQMGRGRSAGKKSPRVGQIRIGPTRQPLIWRGTSADTSSAVSEGTDGAGPAEERATAMRIRDARTLFATWNFAFSGPSSFRPGGGGEEERRESSTPGPLLDTMSLLKQRGRELERFDGLSLIYWYVNSPVPPRCVRACMPGVWGANRRACKFTGMWRLQIGWIWRAWRTHAQEASN